MPTSAYLRASSAIATGLLLLAACSGGAGPMGGTDPAPTISIGGGPVDLKGFGTTATLTAQVTPSDATVGWVIGSPAVASVTGSGLSTTVTAIGGGSTQITATVTSGGRTATTTTRVTVTPIVHSLAFTASSQAIALGAPLTLTPQVTADAGANAAIMWTSSIPSVATPSSAGVVSTLALGTTVISATSVSNPAATASVTLTVQAAPPAVTAVSLSLPAPSLLIGDNGTLTVTVTAAAGADKTITFASSASAVASVDAAGKVTALAAGTTTITATSVATPTVKGTLQVQVRAPAVTAITLALGSTSLSVGDVVTPTLTVVGDAGVSKAVTYLSSATSVATVSASGVVTAVAAGTATISATSVATPAISGTIVLQVATPAVFPVTWTETNDGILGAAITARLAAMAVRPDGSVWGVGPVGQIALRSVAGTWSPIAAPNTNALIAVSAPSQDSAWAVGASGQILRRTSTGTWVVEVSGTTADLNIVTMLPDGTGYAGTALQATLLHRQGGVWSAVPVPPAAYDYSVAGTTLFAALGNAGLKTFNGATWTTITPPGSITLKGIVSVLALSATDVLVGGSDNNFHSGIYRYNGGAWTQEFASTAPGSSNFVTQLTRCADGSIMARTVLGAVLARSGTTWSERNETSIGLPEHGGVNSVACRSTSDWGFQASQGAIGRAIGGTHTFELFHASLNRVSVGSSSFAFATSAGSTVALRWNGTTWAPVLLPHSDVGTGNSPSFTSWGTNVGMGISSDFVGTWTGTTFAWTALSMPAQGMWSSSATDVWAVGADNNFLPQQGGWGGGVQHFTGTWATAVNLGPDATLKAVHGAGSAVYAAGTTGVVRVGSGVIDAVTGSMNDVVAFSATSAIAVGNSGKAFRWNGTQWTAIPITTSEHLLAVTGRSGAEAYAFGDGGSLFGWNGTQWRFIKKFSRVVRAARMAGNTGVAVGDDGIILYASVAAGLRGR